MKNLPKTQLLTLALAAILPTSAYAGNCNPTQVALETAISVATRLPAANNPVIWVDMDYTPDLGVEGIWEEWTGLEPDYLAGFIMENLL